MMNIFETLESRRLLAFALKVNFQPAGSTVPAGYVADSGAVYGNRGNGYTFGWNQSAASFTRDRNSSASPDQRFDTLVHTQLYGARSWEAAVPNGTYTVRIVAGDPNYIDSTIRLAAENTIVADGKLSAAKHFIDASKTITISDGKLSITNAAGASNNKICFVEITDASAPSGPTVSIAATDSSASESGPGSGTFKITRTGSTASALTVGYTIGGSATNGTDYNTIAASVTIPAGATFANVTIAPKSDSAVEGTETVILTLKNAAGINLGNASATVSIADADSSNTNSNWPTSWTSGATLSKKRWESSSVAMDGKIFVFGGWMASSSTGTQQYDVYDVAADKWTTLGYMPVAHTHAALAPDFDNHEIYFAGGLFGSYPGVPSNAVWKYNTLNNTWTQLSSLPQNRSSGALALVNNELHYIGGVEDDRETNSATHLVLNLGNTAAGWSAGPDMPDARDHFSHVVLDGKIIVIGGEFGHDITHDQKALVDSYDPVARTWTRLASMPIAKSHAESATFITPQGRIIVAGGQVDNWKSTDSVVEYNPATNTWTEIGKLPLPLQGPVVQQVGNQIIVATGNPGTGPLGTVWIGNLS